MGEVKPPPNPDATVGGVVLGVVLGLPASVVASILLLTTWDSGSGRMSCTGGVLFGGGALAAMALLAWVTWRIDFRTRGGFGMGVLRGVLTTLTLWMLIPWPCSMTGAGVLSVIDACRRH